MAHANVIYGHYNTYNLHHNLQLAGTYDPRYSQPVGPSKVAATPSTPSPGPEDEVTTEDEELRPGEAIDVASTLVKNILMESDYALENPEEGEVIERFLQVLMKDLFNNLPTIE